MIATSKPRILILGDHFWDRAIFYETQRESPEGGHPVVLQVGETSGPGGAGAVGLAVRAVGGEPVSIQYPRNFRITRGTKTRHVVDGKVVFRADTTVDESDADLIQDEFCGPIQRVKNVDAVIVADYGKGVITYATFAGVVEMSQRLGVPLFVDPAKGRPVEFYRGATAYFPNRNESIGKADAAKARALHWVMRTGREMNLAACVSKLDSEGFVASIRDGSNVTWGESECRPDEVVDVSGAGDHFIAAAAVAKAKGSSWLNAIRAGNRAAGEKCRHWGAAPAVPQPASVSASREQPVS